MERIACALFSLFLALPAGAQTGATGSVRGLATDAQGARVPGVVVSATSPENGTAVEELEVRYSASPLEIGFNSRYLLDITEQIEGEGAQFVMSDAGSPTLVRDSADASALYVLMPMRV